MFLINLTASRTMFSFGETGFITGWGDCGINYLNMKFRQPIRSFLARCEHKYTRKQNQASE